VNTVTFIKKQKAFYQTTTRTLFAVLITISGLLLFPSCESGPAAEDVVIKFFALAGQNKDEEAVKLLTTDLQKDLKQQSDYTSALSTVINKITENRARFEFVDSDQRGDEGAVDCLLTLPDTKEPVKKRIKVVYEEDAGWRIPSQ